MYQHIVNTLLQSVFVDAGAWIRPFGKLVYLMPPYITGATELTLLTQAIGNGLDTLL